MVLNIILLSLIIGLGGCVTTGGYERYGIYKEQYDRIYEHKSSFLDDGNISMAYAIAYWDVLQVKEEEEEKGKISEVFYIWLRNNTTLSILIDPDNLFLLTEKGDTIPLSPVTDDTQIPLMKQQLSPYEIASGYAVFEIKKDVMESDKPSRLVYDDKAGNIAVRYLQIEDMKNYEGLVLEKRVYYYAPVYPRRYWYPYYYPYTYYPYDIHFYYFYHDAPYRHYYYYTPTKPKKREFYAPPPPKVKKREFKSSLFDILFGGDSSDDEQEKKENKKEDKRKREF